MKNLFYTCSVLFFHFQTFSQNQIVSNQIEIGTTSFETYSNSISLSDGGTLLFCSTTSGISGNKTSPNFGASDAWIIKMDASNGIVWQKSFGGTGYDDISDVFETSEGDLLVAATTASPISGNQTSGNHGGSDYWILKLDANGNEIWQKSFGGSGSEQSVGITQISPTRYICSGISDSPISGDKSENCRGSFDTWTILMDENGTVLWDKTYGGNSIDGISDLTYFDASSEIILLGYSDSPISGDKTEANFGLDDAWILKIDLNGGLILQKTLGGDNSDGFSSITKIDSSTFYLVGGSYSGISGNKTSSNYGSSDAWVVKMNLNLNVIEDVNYGGLASDGFESLIITSDNQKLYFGASRSSNSFDLIETSNGLSDCWILSVASDGAINWSELIGGNSIESISIVKEIANNNYRIVAISESGASGDKTLANFGGADFWLFDLSTDLGIIENGISKIDVFPNPFTSNLTMNFQTLKEDVEMVISSTDGKIITKQTILEGTSSINIKIDCEPQLLYYSISGNEVYMSGKLLKM